MQKSEAYAALGLAPGASVDTVKAAFREKAKLWHPDVNDSPQAATEFTRLKAAYDLLTDKTAKPEANPAADVRRPKAGADIEVEVTVSLERAASGGEVPTGTSTGEACVICHGSGRVDTGRRKICSVCSGDGVIVKTHGLFRLRAECVTCKGTGTIVLDDCLACGGSGQCRGGSGGTVTVPPGVADGEVLSFPRRGAPGQDGGSAGSLKVTVRIAPHERFTRRGDDLLMRQAVSFADLCLGGQVQVATIDGTNVAVRIPAGTPSGEVLAIKGHGMPGGQRRGRLLIKVEAAVPQELTGEQRKLLERWRAQELNG